MFHENITAIDLPIVPPMDLNHNLPDIDKISPFPLQLRTRKGVGLFGTRRSVDDGLIRMHEGVDLLAPAGIPVFAASFGKVIGGSGTSCLILHDRGIKYLTFYQHMQNKLVGNDEDVIAGQRIGEVAVDHLHFEIRFPFDNAQPSRGNSLPVDPTNVLDQWEVKTFQNDDEARHVINDVSIKNIEEIWRGRFLRFFLVNVSGTSRDLFLPLIDLSPANLSMLETLKQAFFHSKKVRIVWRESLFFSKIEVTHEKASVIAEVKVLH